MVFRLLCFTKIEKLFERNERIFVLFSVLVFFFFFFSGKTPDKLNGNSMKMVIGKSVRNKTHSTIINCLMPNQFLPFDCKIIYNIYTAFIDCFVVVNCLCAIKKLFHIKTDFVTKMKNRNGMKAPVDRSISLHNVPQQKKSFESFSSYRIGGNLLFPIDTLNIKQKKLSIDTLSLRYFFC